MYFEDIIGQEFAKKYLTNSIKNNKISHAYMFEGIEGIGKKKLTEELAKLLLDISDVKNSPDYIEINPDGNSIKIAQIRKLQTDIIIKPHKDYKIYVINDAHKMTIEGQNALLKTLEEPPKYAIIILVTSNKEALLDTIKSRCEIIKFLPISLIDLKKYLIQKGVDEQRAQLLATFSRGSIEKALELSESSEFALMREEIQSYIERLLDKNIVDILDISLDIEKYRGDIFNILDIMINYFRDIMFIKEKIDKNMIINSDKITFLQNMSKKISYSQVSKIIDIIEETKKKIRSNCNFNISMQVMALNIYEVIK
ncbi:DNA polymerase III subunit delta' C-terminal domain-containing protein [Romboutsia sp. 1001216sp1]|uniref:DNA polymerase III subunit n=1 Tax=unclassified Romboutsia TaxID=2626894 RepID=UPI00189DFA34|nr:MULTISPECIES: DNA polymerase III subunit delta' C-terminal domain-containing protein [unclassified Romboutsia]MDB8789998.1 DNA polymerase III subunit delta' C-terminal domain-containing protein [Romboutsia sp. 1001216sp1]MDB8803052.1 DNA polymerase III subunit delta' C-terminal domain-containing protein [Romboutsia sp. 1001216sp1]MDB8814411.1 DNA polymerase III subunit delta' C-terminal domain-containing protein [Romboutsia sp. 1001216sp1]